MEIQQLVEQLDDLVLRGELLAAIEQFFHDDCIVYSEPKDVLRGKQAKLDSTKHFLNEMASVNQIVLHQQSVGTQVSMSEFTFDFTRKNGQPLVFHEVIRRVWADNKVIDEKYYIGKPSVATPVLPPKFPLAELRTPTGDKVTNFLDGVNVKVVSAFVEQVIPDDPNHPLQATLAMEAEGSVQDIAVVLDLDHDFITDLRVSLIAPTGKTAYLYDQEGGTTTNVRYYYFDQQLMPELIGQPITGDWRLVIHDLSDKFEGKLTSWQLRILPQS